MSKNLSSLAWRKGVEDTLLMRLPQFTDGITEDSSRLKALADEFLFSEATVIGTESFYDFLGEKNAAKQVYVCNGTACKMAGTQQALHKALGEHFEPEAIGQMCCLGRCHENSAFQYHQKNYSGIAASELERIFTNTPENKTLTRDSYPVASNLSQPHLIDHEKTTPTEIYAPLANLFQRGKNALLNEIKTAKLRGRGGAGFPVSIKWDGCRTAQGSPKFIVCNADEGDPGAYSDRYLLEHQPHAVLFGMMVAGFITGAQVGVLYIRAEYPQSIKRMTQAIHEATEVGAIGENIFGIDFNFQLKIVRGAGAYICGEETALLASIEGQRPEVRLRPPFPAQSGLFGKPTVVNNVETFACIGPLLRQGGQAYAQIGTTDSTGSKLLSLDSAFERPGVYEVAMGTPLSDVINKLGGGFKDQRPIKALHIGGPLGGLVPMSKIDELRIDFESFSKAGFLLGHGSIVSIPQDYPLIAYLEHLFEFTASESCGKCFPCRLGSTRGRELLEGAQMEGRKIDRMLFDDLLETLELGSLCALGGGLPLPVKNALDYFSDELAPYFSAQA